MSFAMELEAPAMISGIHVTAPYPSDDPVEWKIEVMASSGGHGLVEVARDKGPVIAKWTPVRGQWIRVTQLGRSDRYWWSITNIVVYGEPVDAPPPIEPPPVIPPEPPPVDPFDPINFSEARARALAEEWGRKYPDWGVYYDEQQVLGVLRSVTVHVTFKVLRTVVLEDGSVVTDQWPWQRPGGIT